MPRKRKSNLSRSTAGAIKKKLDRNQESLIHAEQRRYEQAERQASLRATETPEQYESRLADQAARQAVLRAAETTAQSQSRLESQARRQAALRAAESSEESEWRLVDQAARQAYLRSLETPEQTLERQALDVERHAVRERGINRNSWGAFQKAAFNYNVNIEYRKHRMVVIGRMEKECRFCGALKWAEESPNMCCSGGKISVPCLEEPVEPLRTLLSHETRESRHFLNCVRKYNSCFQMTSFGVDREVLMPGFSPTFTIQGQIYHRIGSLLPSSNENHKFLQIYFIGDEDAETNRRCEYIQDVDRETVISLQRMLNDNNRLIQTFKTALDTIPSQNCKIVIHADKTPRGEHERRYNAPLINEVAAVVTGDQYGPRDIVLQLRDNTLTRVADTHKYYDALQYPLIFWKGQEGYHFEIFQVNPVSKRPIPSKKVSCKDFYAFHLMVRPNNFNLLLRFRQLFHKFIVDMYVKMESERLRYISLNQSKLRAESYIHLQDALSHDANINPNDLGKIVILPSSFINSPRYLHEYTQDAFVYVRTYGRPDLFITFTNNPSWKEISDELMPGQKPIDRHDLIARVFRIKVKKLMAVLNKGKIFGEVLCFMYSIEWQKRGLPHVHILIWLKEKLRSNQIDEVISAEIPDMNEDKQLYDIVVKNMIHGPCGSYNPSAPCMKSGKCTKKYPRTLLKETQHNENGYPLYRRRAPEDGGRTTTIKIRGCSHETTIDNSWIVPYSPILSKMFDAHINVEACNSVRAIKYICKYINKGSDQAIFNVQQEGPRNEVQIYQAGRYISSNEAIWRILAFPLHERHPTVTHLAVHLENGERVYFTTENFEQRMSSRSETTLTAFFKLCHNDQFAKTLFYAEVPRYYTWNSIRKEWKRRVQGRPVEHWPGVKSGDALGRVYTVHASNFECFCLRLLLHSVKGPTCFADLRKINDFEHATYREACEALGLLENDNHWDLTMEEAVQCKSPTKLRELFAILISTCGLSNPVKLWEKYKNDLSEDILHRLSMYITFNEHIFNEALALIENQVMAMSGKNLGEFGMTRPPRLAETSNEVLRELDYDTAELNARLSEMLPKLLSEQRNVFQQVVDRVEKGEGALFFLDAPGGTGKTFLLNLLLAQIRKDKNIAVAVASSGIAATLLDGGRTAHSVLKLPLNLALEEIPTCNISKNSSRGSMLQQCKLLVWDECTMSHKRAVEALNRSLQDIRSSTALMGGMVVLLAGDFRQTLPVIPRGTPYDEINACLKASPLWNKVTKMTLTTNMRVQLYNDRESGAYAETLLKIGEGRFEVDEGGKITLNNEFCNVLTSETDLLNCVYQNLSDNMANENWFSERAILAPRNDTVNGVNEKILDKIPGEVMTYTSIDTVTDADQSTSYPVEFLNSLELSGVPSHKLQLKLGVPVLLMRNLDAPRLCNGTRLFITQLGKNVIGATILTGSAKGEHVLIPRIPIIPTDLPFQFKRLQFPLKLAFGMSINKSQGQTLKVAGLHLEIPCFSHGQLYVACSRVSSAQNLYVFAPDAKTNNIVYRNVL